MKIFKIEALKFIWKFFYFFFENLISFELPSIILKIGWGTLRAVLNSSRRLELFPMLIMKRRKLKIDIDILALGLRMTIDDYLGLA